MKAMVLVKPRTPLVLRDVLKPIPNPGQVLLQVLTCGICRTDLHIVDGELPNAQYPIIPGHQIVGKVVQLGEGVSTFSLGDRVGVPWLQSSCGNCKYCLSNQENLCDRAVYTGFNIPGGFAEFCVANASFCYSLPSAYTNTQAAPLLCAGLIGYRALRFAGNGSKLGFYGFGASAHLLIQVAKQQGRRVFAFTKNAGDAPSRLAAELGAEWVGSSSQLPPESLDAAILFAPVGELVPAALKAVDKAGVVVCAGIHMSDIPSFPYSILWQEKILRSVANLTREDGRQFFDLASRIEIKSRVATYKLDEANQALEDLRLGKEAGAIVLDLEA